MTLPIFAVIHVHFSVSSQEELQQRNHTRNSWAKRRRWRGANGHQGLPQVSNHFPTHPASSSRPRLQAHTGERMRGLMPVSCLCALTFEIERKLSQSLISTSAIVWLGLRSSCMCQVDKSMLSLFFFFFELQNMFCILGL